jgi:hypothetical protein
LGLKVIKGSLRFIEILIAVKAKGECLPGVMVIWFIGL